MRMTVMFSVKGKAGTYAVVVMMTELEMKERPSFMLT